MKIDRRVNNILHILTVEESYIWQHFPSLNINSMLYVAEYSEYNSFVNYSDWVCTAVMSNDVMKDLRG